MTRRRGWRLVRAAWLALAALPIGGALAQATVKVSGFQVTGNTLLDSRAVDAVLLPMLGQRTLEELHRAAAAVQALYAAEGYGAVIAYVPPQAGQDGIVTIAVVEGRLAAVTVSGASRFSSANIKASLPALEIGATPRLRHIDAQLRIANENPAKQAQVLLKPGVKAGEAEAEVTVTELPLQRVNVGLDNTGNERTGDYRISLGWQHADLSGHDDVASAQVQTSPSKPSQVRLLSAGYRWPLYRQRMVLDAFAAYSDVDGGSAQSLAGDLRFNGRGRILGLRAGWYLPRWGEFDQRVTFGLDRRDYLNQCDIAGQPAGACGPAGASVSVSPASLEYALQSAGAMPLAFNASVHHNLGLGGRHSDSASFDAVRVGARARYSAWRFGLYAALPVYEVWQLRARLNGQLSADALVSGEQFGLGGASSVRGYEERELVGDSGAVASLELGGPSLLAADAAGATLRLHSFVDAGVASNQGEAPCVDVRSRCAVASVGLGARYATGSLQARLDLAYPLKSAARTQRGDTRAHVSVQYGF